MDMNLKNLISGLLGGFVGFISGAVLSLPFALAGGLLIGGIGALAALLTGADSIFSNTTAISSGIVLLLIALIYALMLSRKSFYACSRLGFRQGILLTLQNIKNKYRRSLFRRDPSFYARIDAIKMVRDRRKAAQKQPQLNQKLTIFEKIYLVNETPLPKTQLLSFKEIENFKKTCTPDEAKKLNEYQSYFKDNKHLPKKCVLTQKNIKELKDPITVEQTVGSDQTQQVFDRIALTRLIETQGLEAKNPSNQERLNQESIKIYRGFPKWIEHFIMFVRNKLAFSHHIEVKAPKLSETSQISSLDKKSSEIKPEPTDHLLENRNRRPR